MRTLEYEQVSELRANATALLDTAQAGCILANFCRGAIRGCDATNDPDDRIKTMLTKFLEMAGFEVAP